MLVVCVTRKRREGEREREQQIMWMEPLVEQVAL